MSKIRNEFIFPPDVDCIKGKYTVKCKHCSKDVGVVAGSTSNFWGHLKVGLYLYVSLTKNHDE